MMAPTIHAPDCAQTGVSQMLRVFRHYLPTGLLWGALSEGLLLLLALPVSALLLWIPMFGREVNPPAGFILPQGSGVFALTMLCGMMVTGCYQRDVRDPAPQLALRIALGICVGLVIFALVQRWVLRASPPAAGVALATTLSLIGIASNRLLCASANARLFSRRVLVLGAGARAQRIESLRRASDRNGVQLVAFIRHGETQARVNPARLVLPSASLATLARRFGASEVVVALDDRRVGFPEQELLDCKMQGIRVTEDIAFLERQRGCVLLEGLGAGDLIFADGYTQAVRGGRMKRAMDVFVAACLILLAAPLMLLVALAIMIESGAPVVYVQERVGQDGRVFRLYKFRSMRHDAEANGEAVWAQQGDRRVTRLGRFLRQTRLDELPQLFNVLIGDMSLVGPRPERPAFVANLEREIPFYALRHRVKPGITGWAQICFPYGASTADAREKLQYDLYYLKNYSLLLDLMILCQTAQVILWGKGAR